MIRLSVGQGVARAVIPDEVDVDGPLLHDLEQKLALEGRVHEFTFFSIFGMGGSSVIARLLGEDRKKESGATMNFCVYAMAIAGIATLVLGLAFLLYKLLIIPVA